MFGIKSKIKAINGGKENDYRKDYIKIKFKSDDDLLSNKPLKFHTMTIIIRSVSEESGKLYPQLFLDDACMDYKNVAIQKNWCFRKNWHW